MRRKLTFSPCEFTFILDIIQIFHKAWTLAICLLSIFPQNLINIVAPSVKTHLIFIPHIIWIYSKVWPQGSVYLFFIKIESTLFPLCEKNRLILSFIWCDYHFFVYKFLNIYMFLFFAPRIIYSPPPMPQHRRRTARMERCSLVIIALAFDWSRPWVTRLEVPSDTPSRQERKRERERERDMRYEVKEILMNL